jgi:NAD(P)-dependent dehydrogenase (short-subunit alcohol dehydrogenase family)
VPADRVVLLIGATSGMGLASALQFAQRGDRLVLAARSHEALTAAADACRSAGAPRVDTVAADVGVHTDVEAVVQHALELHARIDVAVLTAASMAYGTVEKVPADVFEQIVRTAVFGTANVARTVMPVLRRQGRGTLIVVNSLLGSVTVPQMSTYSAAKWGQRALVRTLQQENRGERDVHVCLVSPGAVNTPIYYQAANYLGRAVRPPRPVGVPERVARVIVGLADRPRKHTSIPVGPINPLIVAGFRFLPGVYDRIVEPALRLLSVTRHPAEDTPGNVLIPRPEGERIHGHWPDDPR